MNARLLTAAEVNRQEWDALVKGSEQGMFYHLCSFMDLVAPGWCLIEVRNDGRLVGGMPLLVQRKGMITYSFQPYFTQYWGPVIAPQDHSSNYKRFSHERKVLITLLDALPASLKLIRISCSPALAYGSPMHWAGFELHTRYTLRIAPEADETRRMASLAGNTRTDVKKGSHWQGHMNSEGSASDFIKLVDQNLAAGRNVMLPEKREHAAAVIDHLRREGLGQLLLAQRPGEAPVAGVVLTRFRQLMTYNMGASAPGGEGAEAMSWLLWNAMGQAAREGLTFDFEGSMKESLDAFFRGFGARPVPYLHIVRNRLPLFLRWIKK